jgi:hypothetical protein
MPADPFGYASPGYVHYSSNNNPQSPLTSIEVVSGFS